MARYQLNLTYDGTEFRGLQRLKKERTVQAEIEKALKKLNWTGSSIITAARTDTGVHARGQVVVFDLEWAHSEDKLVSALNAWLPRDISVTEARKTDAGFHPRYDAIARRYSYSVFFSPYRNPLKERYFWRIWPPIQVDGSEIINDYLKGEHDFRAFGAPTQPGGSTIRRINNSGWEWFESQAVFHITANAFLYHMVRRIVFLQVSFFRKKLSLESWIAGIMDQREMIAGLAPPQGLVLENVIYEHPE